MIDKKRIEIEKLTIKTKDFIENNYKKYHSLFEKEGYVESYQKRITDENGILFFVNIDIFYLDDKYKLPKNFNRASMTCNIQFRDYDNMLFNINLSCENFTLTEIEDKCFRLFKRNGFMYYEENYGVDNLIKEKFLALTEKEKIEDSIKDSILKATTVNKI